MNKLVADWVVRLHQKKVKYLIELIEPLLGESKKVLDLGCGSGEVSKALMESGYLVTSVDVVDKVKVDGVKVLVYDGVNIPFKDKQFEMVLLITVLHHVNDFEKLLIEAGRVAKKVIVVEDVYENWWDRLNIWFWDSVLNLEFFGHPHQNRDDAGWKKVFGEIGFELLTERSGKIRELVYEFKQKAYLIQRRSDTAKQGV
ncbi:hypothetical protein A2572_02655 [Candidatus Collierbacteria bacterium RIFOXYD1_FULL_40_9]|uniref:Methyltransferase type 11 domain-containing protein n=1 Tax=Candidatus Collierbacteria bacterium RIFOXYD1_FULL_40_9 TaxID=1817731 RepID=A0A1F5FW79_9BACT|nr:MAG: hypothetical protein A2572_02655 [Candidatus Collierbacteria bacterium RIFOXYD1_FULL_40_9]